MRNLSLSDETLEEMAARVQRIVGLPCLGDGHVLPVGDTALYVSVGRAVRWIVRDAGRKTAGRPIAIHWTLSSEDEAAIGGMRAAIVARCAANPESARWRLPVPAGAAGIKP